MEEKRRAAARVQSVVSYWSGLKAGLWTGTNYSMLNQTKVTGKIGNWKTYFPELSHATVSLQHSHVVNHVSQTVLSGLMGLMNIDHSAWDFAVRVCLWVFRRGIWEWDVCLHQGAPLTARLVCHTVKTVNDVPQACSTATPGPHPHIVTWARLECHTPILLSLPPNSNLVKMPSVEALSWQDHQIHPGMDLFVGRADEEIVKLWGNSRIQCTCGLGNRTRWDMYGCRAKCWRESCVSDKCVWEVLTPKTQIPPHIPTSQRHSAANNNLFVCTHKKWWL